MGYRLEWRLLGRENQLLDLGDLDGVFPNEQCAYEALAAFLSNYALWVREPGGDSWSARRSPDADLQVLIRLLRVAPEAPLLPTPILLPIRPDLRLAA